MPQKQWAESRLEESAKEMAIIEGRKAIMTRLKEQYRNGRRAQKGRPVKRNPTSDVIPKEAIDAAFRAAGLL